MVEENKTKRKEHVDRMAENRLPKKIMNYRPIGKRDLGRPRKRWLDDRDRNSESSHNAGTPVNRVRYIKGLCAGDNCRTGIPDNLRTMGASNAPSSHETEEIGHLPTIASALRIGSDEFSKNIVTDTGQPLLQHDNDHPHISAMTTEYMQHLGFAVVNRPSYSPDLAPSDFNLFPKIKKHLRGHPFEAVVHYEHEQTNVAQYWCRYIDHDKQPSISDECLSGAHFLLLKKLDYSTLLQTHRRSAVMNRWLQDIRVRAVETYIRGNSVIFAQRQLRRGENRNHRNPDGKTKCARERIYAHKGKGVELFSEVPSANAWIIKKQGLSSSEWRDMIKMTALVAPVRALPGRPTGTSHCRHCSEFESLPHVLGRCPQGEISRIKRNIIRSLLAAALRNKGLEVYEEVHCLSDQDSVRRIDIIAITREKSVAEIIDPTIRFELSKAQPMDVDKEKKEIDETTMPYFHNKYNVHNISVTGLLFGVPRNSP
ncbi:hypothetical protein ANN_13155 [Periplaneta americana]|uniref:Reverse transcriptase n=1 Tax=Periplaneta americana TaxID=6978 RepID=A0ABQ8TJ48_PERAM|nr:hypothetical protein ANN_13155 [Periplaneta americana]